MTAAAVLGAPPAPPAPQTLTLTTIDGEQRTVHLCPDGSWRCPFCLNYNYPPERLPPGVRHDREWDQPCRVRHCIVGGSHTAEATAAHRKAEAARLAAAEASAALTARVKAVHGPVREVALEFGFGWGCTITPRDGSPMCEASGLDRGELTEHMRILHARKALHGTPKIKLRRRPPGASLGKLPCDPFAPIAWTQHHAEPVPCSCGHARDDHGPQLIPEDEAPPHRRGRSRRPERSWIGPGCTGCACQRPYHEIEPIRSHAGRTGQFWAAGPQPGTVWVLPDAPAPWETGRAEPVAAVRGQDPQHSLLNTPTRTLYRTQMRDRLRPPERDQRTEGQSL